MDLHRSKVFKTLLGRVKAAYVTEVHLGRASDAMADLRRFVRKQVVPNFNPQSHAPDDLDSSVFHDLLENYGLVKAGLWKGPSGLREIHAFIRKYAATWRKK